MRDTRHFDPASIPVDIRAEKISMIGNYAILVDWSDKQNTASSQLIVKLLK